MMKMRRPHKILRDNRGAAAAEFAMMLPIFMIMLFVFWEGGRFVEGNHAVAKAVRDGVRFAARQPWSAYGCGGGGGGLNEAEIKNQVLRTLGSWGATAGDITVSFTCGNSSTGIYDGLAGGAPVVTVAASVGYTTLFGDLGQMAGLNLNASAESPVMGI